MNRISWPEFSVFGKKTKSQEIDLRKGFPPDPFYQRIAGLAV
jgi:hypothetical protein